MPKEITIPSQTVFQEIQSLEEYPEDKFVRVVIGTIDADGVFIVPQQFKTYIIKNDDYTELMSPNPSWNPEKPGGTYFNDDLWHFIDQQNG